MKKRTWLLVYMAISFGIAQIASYVMQSDMFTGLAKTISVLVFLIAATVLVLFLSRWVAFGKVLKASGKDKVLFDEWTRFLTNRAFAYSYALLLCLIAAWHFLSIRLQIDQRLITTGLMTIGAISPVFIFAYLNAKDDES